MPDGNGQHADAATVKVWQPPLRSGHQQSSFCP
uniref:Uncharacterized protein n=1 Tax=Rhizophora mucronata TaxID=61149 RepID=A0A2P2LIL1_RHIMU